MCDKIYFENRLDFFDNDECEIYGDLKSEDYKKIVR